MRPLLVAFSLLLTTSLTGAVPPVPSKAELHAWLDEALENAKQVPPEQRRELAYSLQTVKGARVDRIRSSIQKLALRPSSPGWYDLILAMGASRVTTENFEQALAEHQADRAAAIEFLDGIYRARAGVSDENAIHWQHGLAEMLFTLGNFEEALRLEREVVARNPRGYYIILLAMMEKVQGNDEPFARVMADCPESPSSDEGQGRAYCATVVQSVGRRFLRMLDASRIPAALHEMMSGGDRWEETLHALELTRTADAALVEKRLGKILTSNAPAWAKDDAVYMLARIRKSASLYDCWLARSGVAIPPATEETWKQLAALPLDEKNDNFAVGNAAGCYQHHDPEQSAMPTTGCLLMTAMRQVDIAVNAKNHLAERSAIERMATLVLASRQGLIMLANLIAISAMSAPTDAERDQILRYVSTLQVKPAVDQGEIGAAVRTQTTRDAVSAPWTSPTPIAPSSPSCP